MDVKYSLLQGRESDIFREEKIQKERNLSRGPMTKGHLTERSFLDLIQMQEIGTKKSFQWEISVDKWNAHFFRTSLVFQRSWKREVRKNLGCTKLKTFM